MTTKPAQGTQPAGDSIDGDELREHVRLLALSEGWLLDDLERMTRLEHNSITAVRLAGAVLRLLYMQAAEDLQASHQQTAQQAEGQA